MQYTRQLAASGVDGDGEGSSENGGQPGVKVLGEDPETGLQVTLRDGRFGPFVQLGDGEKPKRSSLPTGLRPRGRSGEGPASSWRCRARSRHPESGEPILASIGRYGPYVQHGKTYANLGAGDDVLEIGGNRAIDLIVAKESGGAAPAEVRPIRAATSARSGERQDHRGEGRTLRSLRDRRRDQRHPAADDCAGSRDAGPGGRASQGAPGAGPSKKPLAAARLRPRRLAAKAKSLPRRKAPKASGEEDRRGQEGGRQEGRPAKKLLPRRNPPRQRRLRVWAMAVAVELDEEIEIAAPLRTQRSPGW